jgi:hypothetical protein
VRRVEDITEALWGMRVSPSTVSDLNKKIYATIEGWRNRPIESEDPYVYLDGIVLKRSWAGEVRNVSLLVAIGVNNDGYREILGICEGAKEDKAGWSAFLKHLKDRGRGKWVEIAIAMDPLYLSVLVSAEKKFWRCVQSGETPHLINAEPPRPRIEAIRIVDMSASNSWAEFAALFRNTREAFLDHERAKNELKALMPEDAREAIGHGVRGKRSKSGAVSFDVLATTEAIHAPVQ